MGVIGAGQLGLMLGNAGKSLDLECVFLDPAPNPPAARVGSVLSAPFDSKEGVDLLASCDVVTYEFENVPVAAVERLAKRVPVFPSAIALHQGQDREREKRLFESLDIPVAAWRAVSSREDLEGAIAAVGLPLVLKTRRFGYDGKGQALVRSAADADAAWQELRAHPLIAEQWLCFDREVSAIGARSASGEVVFYPLSENQHRDGILRVSRAPADGEVVGDIARAHLRKLLEHLEYVGVLALETFVAGDRVIANEFAPRVHNSGHWTIEGSETSQFENHLRAILDLSLGNTASLGHAGMINLVGRMPDNLDALKAAGFQLHDYGKQARPGRKLGHLTIVARDAITRDLKLSNALKLLGN